MALLRALVAASVLLLPLAVRADDQPAKVDAPLLISDTSWNFTRGTAWRKSEIVAGTARDDLFVEFTNPQDKDIAEIRLHVRRCGVKGSSIDGGWMKLKGPFAAHGTFKVTPSMPSGGSISQSIGSSGFDGTSAGDHMKITEVVVVDGDGTQYQFSSDLSKVLSDNISNFCANY